MKRIIASVTILFAVCSGRMIHAQQVESLLGIEADLMATIIGSEEEVCKGDSVAAYISFFGSNGPWDIIINDKDGKYLTLKKIEENFTLWLKPTENNEYYISKVEDKRGRDGKSEGKVTITVLEPTPVTILLDRKEYFHTEDRVNLASAPPGASFIGPGVSGTFFYPFIATPEGSPHTITAVYTNSSGCKSTDNMNIHVLYGEGEVQLFSGDDPVTTVCDNGETFEIRGTNLDNIPGQFQLRKAGSPDPVTGHISDKDLKDDMAILDVTGLTGSYYIFYTYTYKSLTANISMLFKVDDLGINGIQGLPEAVCKNDDPYPLVPDVGTSDPGASYLFTGPGVSGNQEEGFFYDPGDPEAVVGQNKIELQYTSGGGCSSGFTKIVTNRAVPDALFTLEPACLPEGGGLVIFENLTSDKEMVSKWSWDFGDPLSGADNYSNLESPDHYFEEAGLRHIILSATTSEGCVAVHALDTVLTDKPLVDFTWSDDCFEEGRTVSFIDRSLSAYASLDSLIWTFRKNDGSLMGVTETGNPAESVEFKFPGPGEYLVHLRVRNTVGCESDATKELVMKPTLVLTEAGYTDGFNQQNTNWSSLSDGGSMIWRRDVPEFRGFIPVSGDLAWFTDLPLNNSETLDPSWVQSGCLDFSNLRNPFIQLDMLKSFMPGRDGTVLQYQDVVGEGWKTIGKIGDGLNWYNASTIVNQPGGSDTGWGLDQFIPDNKWVNASHDLDMLAGLSHVKFRIAIGTGGSQMIGNNGYNQGFAFDNVFIGERFRMSLLEYFTNSAAEECKTADELVDQFSMNHQGSLIDLQYHMDYPGIDPMNLNNPYPASTRSFNYGVQDVPLAILNGGDQFDFSDSSSVPGPSALKQVSLEVPLFDVALDVNWMVNSLEATTLVTCRTDNFSSNVQLYVAIIETSVTAYPGLNQDSVFRNVVLDMIPTPAGKLLGDQWYNGKSDSRSFSWEYREYIEDLEDLAVVAFVQDRDNGQVLQADVSYLTPMVGSKGPRMEARSMAVYPNPATEWVFVNLGSDNPGQGMLKIMDLSGKDVMTTNVIPGYLIYSLDVTHLNGGMYMIYWLESGVVKTRKKLVITR